MYVHTHTENMQKKNYTCSTHFFHRYSGYITGMEARKS